MNATTPDRLEIVRTLTGLGSVLLFATAILITTMSIPVSLLGGARDAATHQVALIMTGVALIGACLQARLNRRFRVEGCQAGSRFSRHDRILRRMPWILAVVAVATGLLAGAFFARTGPRIPGYVPIFATTHALIHAVALIWLCSPMTLKDKEWDPERLGGIPEWLATTFHRGVAVTDLVLGVGALILATQVLEIQAHMLCAFRSPLWFRCYFALSLFPAPILAFVQLRELAFGRASRRTVA